MYAKLIDNKLEYAKTNFTTDDRQTVCNFNLDEGLMLQNGFKPVIEAEKPVYPYDVSYYETAGEIVEMITPNLERARGKCIELNDRLRDEALLSGVTYQNVLFDSDTDQKVNLIATVSAMSDEDTVTWYGMDNQGLLCSKADLTAIGGLITELHSYCWEMNAYIKEQIQNAQTIEELNNIEISYIKADS